LSLDRFTGKKIASKSDLTEKKSMVWQESEARARHKRGTDGDIMISSPGYSKPLPATQSDLFGRMV
jgi:hypothetical protein